MFSEHPRADRQPERFAINCKSVPTLPRAEDRHSSQALSDIALALVAQSLSENTRKGYKADLAHYAATGRIIPSTPEMIAGYLADGSHMYAVATLQRRLAAISKAHRAIGDDDPCRSEIVQAVMRGVRRLRGVAQRQAQALLRDDLFAVLDRIADRTKDIRDRALLLLGWAVRRQGF